MEQKTNLPKVVLCQNRPGTIFNRISIRGHEVYSDEEPLYGGHDDAPDPFDYLLAGVGSCSMISLRQFSERKAWDIGEIEVKLSYDEVDGEHVVHKETSFTGDITEAQRKVLLRVANCGTEKAMEKGFKFFNTIKDQ